jgi:hypothetical protein
MKKRKLAWALCLALTTGVLYTVYASIEKVERADSERRAQYEKDLTQHRETIGVVEDLANSARTIAEWEAVRKRATSLPADAKKHFSLRADIGTMELLARRRDHLLFNAGVLFRVNERDPGVQLNLTQAKDLQDQVEKLLKQIGDLSNTSTAMARQYRDAYEKYRSLAFLQPNEADKALDIIDDALHNLKRANGIAPKHNDVELFVEFLYKRAKEEENKRGGSPKTGGPPRSLPNRPGQDNPGNERTDRPNRH